MDYFVVEYVFESHYLSHHYCRISAYCAMLEPHTLMIRYALIDNDDDDDDGGDDDDDDDDDDDEEDDDDHNSDNDNDDNDNDNDIVISVENGYE